MKNGSYIAIIFVIAVLLFISLIPENPLNEINWALFSALVISILIFFVFWQFERKRFNSKEITLIATMASLAAISRIPFAAIMSLQPTTFIVMITGYVFGSQIGFIVGAAAALVSNFFLGQGPWTPWQMFCWGMCGVFAGLLGGKTKTLKIISFTILGGVCGYFYGWTMNLWHWVGFVYPLTWKTFLATYAASISFDTLHSIGNIIFSVIFGKSFYQILMRFKKRILPTITAEDIENPLFRL